MSITFVAPRFLAKSLEDATRRCANGVRTPTGRHLYFGPNADTMLADIPAVCVEAPASMTPTMTNIAAL